MDPDLPHMLALQAGDAAALDALMAAHRAPLSRFLVRYLRDATAAEDVAQETFVRVYFKAATFKPQSTVRAWIYAIAVNLCRDHFRRSVRHADTISLEHRQEGLPGTRDPIDPGPDPQAQAARGEQIEALRDALAKLPDRLRLALVLFSIEGYSQKETADMLGITPKTVELRVYRAKEKLRSRLGPAYLGEG